MRTRTAFFSKQRKKQTGAKQHKRPALIRIIAIPAIIVAGCILWNYYHSVPINKLVILILDFPDSQNYHLAENIAERLRKASKKYDDVEIQLLTESLPAQDNEIARAKGRERKAGIVLWGRYEKRESEETLNIYFEILYNRIVFRLTPEKKETFNVAAAAPRSFTLQQPLSLKQASLTSLTLGLSRYCIQDFEGAISHFNDAIAQYSEADRIDSLKILYAYRGISHFYLYKQTGDQRLIDTAIDDYTQAIKINSYAPINHFNRGIAYFEKGEYDHAIADCSQAITLKPDYAESYFVRGNSFSEKGVIDLAIADYDQALRFNPQYAAAYNNRGDAYLGKQDLDRAIADYNRAITLRPDLAIAYYNRGRAYAIKGDTEIALANFNKVLQLTKNSYQRQRAIRSIEELNIN